MLNIVKSKNGSCVDEVVRIAVGASVSASSPPLPLLLLSSVWRNAPACVPWNGSMLAETGADYNIILCTTNALSNRERHDLMRLCCKSLSTLSQKSETVAVFIFGRPIFKPIWMLMRKTSFISTPAFSTPTFSMVPGFPVPCFQSPLTF